MRVLTITTIGVIFIMALLGCNSTDKPQENSNPPIKPPPITEVTINVEGYTAWGDYASLYTLFSKVWTRICLLVVLIIGLTEFLKTKIPIKNKLLLSFLSGVIFFIGKTGLFFLLKWFKSDVDFQIGETFLDILFATILANWIYILAINKLRDKIKSKIKPV